MPPSITSLLLIPSTQPRLDLRPTYSHDLCQHPEDMDMYLRNSTAMERLAIVLDSLAAGGDKAVFDPVQMQKVLFLIDKELPEFIGGQYCNFKP